jgi:PAS domain S-box-containing protein
LLSIYTFFAAAAAIVCTILALIIYFRNHKGFLNQIFIITTVFGAYWAVTILMMVLAGDAQTALLWKKIGFLYPVLYTLIFQFTLAFTQNRYAKSKLVFLLTLVPSVVLAFCDLLTEEISGPPVMQYSGYGFLGQPSLANTIFNVWTFGLALGAVYFSFRFFLKLKDENEKNKAKLVAIAVSMPLVFKVLVKLISLTLGITIPFYGPSVDSLLCLIISYTIWKYDLFNLNPAIAAENIISTMPDSFILTDPNQLILRANTALTELLGYQENELIGKKLDVLLDETQNRQLLEKIGEMQEIRGWETEISTKNGVRKPIAVHASLIKDKRGGKLGITIIIHDLTRQKQDQEKIVRSERFATIGELAGMVGHDLRNPLSSIQAATYYINKKNANQLDSTSQEMLQVINTSIQYSNKIVNDLLDYSRELTLELEDSTPTQLTQNALLMVEVPVNIEVANLAQSEPVVNVDKVKISRVIVNIIKNSFDAMPEGGKLTITSHQSSNSLELCFKDTGVGIPADVQAKLWKPLVTTKAKGMGFGLAICKRVVDAHGGKIQVQSIVGEGSTFIVTLPIEH